MTAKVLFVASTGGHLAELTRIASTETFVELEQSWHSFDTRQAHAMLDQHRLHVVPYIGPRAYWRFITSLGSVFRVVRGERPNIVISTGAAVALSAFLCARLLSIPCIYIESLSRTDGPSLTGRLVSLLHLASTCTQHSKWSSGRWRVYPSLLAAYEPEPSHEKLVARSVERSSDLTIFVTVGTTENYRFDSLVDAVLRTGLASETTTWQLGCTTRSGLPGRALAFMDVNEFSTAARAADVVITHAGVGSILEVLDAGCYPIVVPRRRHRAEHVDDHQSQIARPLRDRKIALVAESNDITAGTIYSVRGRRVRAITSAPGSA